MKRRMKFGLLGLVLLVGCASRPKPPVAIKPPPATRPVVTGSPVIDIARGGGGLPLDDAGDLASRDQLIEGFRKGYERRIALSDPTSWITLVGADHRKLDLLKIDLSNQSVRDDYKPSQYQKPGEPQPGIHADRFEYLAWPLLYKNGATRWRISATDARFSLLHDKSGHDTLVLSEAQEGSFEFSVLLSDIKPMLQRTAGANSSAGFVLKDVDVTFSSDNPKSLTIDTRVQAIILFVPTTFRIHARADVDEWCNVKLSELSCTGEDAGGALVASLAEPAMQKQNGKLLPLVKWPGDQMVIKDVWITLDDALSINATFGRE